MTAPSAQQRAVIEHKLNGPALVDAGAGTGKTFTIVERVAQLHEDAAAGRGCKASNILLLTFSKKAAAELRGRIGRRLGPGVEPPECATFHAFALGLLTEYAFELDLSPDFTLVNDIDARVEFWKAFDDLVCAPLGPEGSGFALRYGVMENLCAALYDVRQKLRDESIAIDAFCERARQAAADFAALGLRRLVEPRRRGAPKVLAEIDDADFAEEVREEHRRIEAAGALFRNFDQRLSQRNVLTYADLLARAEALVRSRSDVAGALRRRFEHCIVDEYQDTDPRQVRLLEAIFGSALERVMVVGDPRQTIYAFRGARPGNIDDFGRLPGCTLYVLAENRRSQQEILDLAHAVIQPDFKDDPAPLRAVRGGTGAPVVHAASRWPSFDGAPPNAAQCREFEADWVAGQIVRLLHSGRLVERPGAPDTLEPLAPRHIAILNRRKTQLQPLLNALNAADVPFRQYGGAGFYEAPEVLDALAWFRLVADPFDDNAIARVIAAPSVGLSDAATAALCKDMRDRRERLAQRALVDPLPEDFDPESRERVQRLRRIVESLEAHAGAPLVVAWEATLERAGLSLTTERLGHRRDQARANLEKLSSMVRAFADRNPGSRVVDFVRYMRELNRADADEQEADPPSADAVNVMTIHAAKGLEWPIVFLIDVWPKPPHDKAPARIDRRTGAFLVSEGANGRKPFHTLAIEVAADSSGCAAASTPGDGDDDESAGEKAERDREERRLFYVAITRARDELWVSGPRSRPSKEHPQGQPHVFLARVTRWLDDVGWKTVDEPVEGGLRFRRAAESQGSTSVPLAAFASNGESRPVVSLPALSFSSIAQYEKCPRSATYRLAFHLPGLASADAMRWSGKVQPAVPREAAHGSLLSLGTYGELVHRALELWARNSGENAGAYLAAAVSDLGLKPSKKERVMAVDMIDAVKSALSGWTPCFAEAPFTLDFDGIALSGFIDLIAKDANGDWFVIDYKTGVTPANEYALQLALYRQAAAEAYGLPIAGCRIARIGEAACALENVVLPDAAEMRRRIAGVAAGIRCADVTATPGPHCGLCPYRAAPCMDFVAS